MTDREKFIEWVVEVYPNAIWSPAQLDALQRFASLAQAEAFERAAEYVGRNLMSCCEYEDAIRALKEK